MARRHKRESYDGRRRELNRRQQLADLDQASIDREQAVVGGGQAQLTRRWTHAAMVQAISGPVDRVAQTALRRIVLELVEDQRRHDVRQALLDRTQSAADTVQHVIDAQQTKLDDLTLTAAQAHAVHRRGTRQRASVGRRRSRARNAGVLANECS